MIAWRLKKTKASPLERDSISRHLAKKHLFLINYIPLGRVCHIKRTKGQTSDEVSWASRALESRPSR